MRVLIAEDSLVLQRLYARCFEKAGIKPVIVSDGQQALEACLGRGTQRYQQQRHQQHAQHPFDVILMVRDGWDVCLTLWLLRLRIRTLL